MKKILLAIPAHRDDECFDFALSSALIQNKDVTNIVVFDNNINRINKYGNENELKFKYIKNDVDIGYLANFVKCWKYSDEKYFIWLGDDDFLAPGFADLILREIESAKSPVVAWSGIPTSFNSISGVNRIGFYNPDISSKSPVIRILQCMRFGKYNYPFYSIYNRSYISIEPLDALIDWPVPCDGIDWAWSYYISFAGEIRNISSQLYFYRNENWIDSSPLIRLKNNYKENIIKKRYNQNEVFADVAIRVNRLVTFMIVMLIGLKKIIDLKDESKINYTKNINNIFWIFYDSVILRRDWPIKSDLAAAYINREIMCRGRILNINELLNILTEIHDELVTENYAITKTYRDSIAKNLPINLNFDFINEEAEKINIYLKIYRVRIKKYYALFLTLINIKFLYKSLMN